MSTLSTSAPPISSPPEVDARFDALVHSAVPARSPAAGVDFATVFDLDYGQSLLGASPARSPKTDGPARLLAVQPRPITSRPITAHRGTAHRVRLTRRGRMVIVLALLVLALGAMTALGGWAAAGLSGGTPEPVRVIEVAPGQTLYGIAAELAQPGEIRAMVHRIQELNSLPGGQITEGQKLAVPRG